jgi:ribose/xylose/arabinose/galactoside ABC-type transport system permease subunit
VPGDWYLAFLGVLLLLAVIVNNYIRQRAAQTRH